MRLFKVIIIFFSIIFSFSKSYSQVPNNLSFQAVIRNASNQLVVSSPVGIRVSLLQGGVNGTAVYSETHAVSTNSNGLVTLEIGAGSILNGNFKTVDWSKGNYFIKIEADPAGGTNYSIVTSSQLLSVPYALYAKKSADFDSLNSKLKTLDSIVSKSVFLGKKIILITGDIDELGVKDKLLKEFGSNTELIIVTRCNRLVRLDLSMINRSVKFEIENNQLLKEIDISNLPLIDDKVIIWNNPLLTFVNLSKVKNIIYSPRFNGFTNGEPPFSIYGDSLTHIQFDSLTSIVGDINFGGPSFKNFSNNQLQDLPLAYLGINGSQNISLNNLINSQFISLNGSFDTVRLSKLKFIESLSATGSIKNIYLDSLTNAGFIDLSGVSGLKELNLPNLRKLTNIRLEGSPVQSIRFDKLESLGENNSYYSIYINASLSSTEVNYILSVFARILPPVPPNGSIFIQLNQSIPAPPTGQGIIDKNILIARGYNVNTD